MGMIRNRPPFDELKSLIESAGYEVISIGAEQSDMRFSGVITLKIAPEDWLDQTDFMSFPRIPQDFVAKCREYAAQRCQQEKGNCQE